MNILWCTMCLAILTTVPDVSFGFYFHPVTSRTVQIYKLGWNRFNRPTKLQSRSSDDLNSNELTTRPRTLCRSIYRVAFPVAIFSTVALLVRVLKTGAISSKPPSRTPFLYQEKHQVVSSENITAPVDREEDYSSSSSADDQPCPCISTVDGPSDQIIDDPVVDQPTAPATVDTSTIAMLDNTPPSITSNIDGSPSSTPPGDEEHVLSPDISIEDRRKQFAQEIERHGVEAGAKTEDVSEIMVLGSLLPYRELKRLMVSYSSGKAGLEEQEDSPIGELTYLDRLLPMMWASSGKNWSVFRNLVDVEIRPQAERNAKGLFDASSLAQIPPIARMRRWIHEVNPEEPLPPTSKQSRRKSKSNNADTSAERILLITLLLNNLRRIHDNDFDVILEVVRKAVEDMNVTKEKKGFDRVMAEEGKMRTP